MGSSARSATATLSPTPVLDLTDRVSQDGGERGLLGIAFSPDGQPLYLDSTDNDGNTQIDQFTMNVNVVAFVTAHDPHRRPAATQPQRRAARVRARRGPVYRLGDGGAEGDSGAGHAPGGNGQSLDTLLGKVLRSHRTGARRAPYTVPVDNPFVAEGTRARRSGRTGCATRGASCSTVRTGDLWIGDVGQNEWEEIDHVVAMKGRHAGRVIFGWNGWKASTCIVAACRRHGGAVDEIFTNTGACAVAVASSPGTKILVAVGHDYLFSDMVRFRDPCARRRRRWWPTMQDAGAASESGLASFGQANNGTLYVIFLADGIFRIDAGDPLGLPDRFTTRPATRR